MIILPRQARDKHRESTQSRDRFLAVIETVPCDDMPVGPNDGIRYKHDFRCPNATDAPQLLRLTLPAGVTKVAVWESAAVSDTNHR